MNYRHIYHAGNFADIVKHLVLIAVLEQFKQKEKPFAVLDAFAGMGLYDLSSIAASKTLEHNNGIGKLLKITNSPALLQTFLNIKNLAGENHYPGSPFIITKLLRPQDRLIACELHPEDYLSLKKLLSNNIQHIDAYNAIKAFLPFQEKRGLIFLDPPFEVKNEFQKLLTALKQIKSSALNNSVLIWYPIKDLLLVRDFYHNYKNIGFKETFIIEYELLYSDKNMIKCGLMLINPPNIKKELEELIEYLSNTLNLKFTYIDL
ncbi:MAG: 23S rRNA (adenine(2030)-N(6))-methyltransferase RlmJ [Rickettsia endosymbiont of Pentastiridius leporinus]